MSDELKKLKLQQCIAGDDCFVNTMSTLKIAARAAGKTKPKYGDFMLSLTKACNTHNATNSCKIHAKSIPTQQVLMGEVNHYNDDNDDKFFDETDYTAFDIQNVPPNTLRLFTTNLLAVQGSISKRRQKRNFNHKIDIPPAAFKELSNEGVKLWYQFDNKDRKIIVSMHDYLKEGSSAMVPYSKHKSTPNPRFRNYNRDSNRLTNSTDILNDRKDLVTHNNLESFLSQIISSFALSITTQPEYQILSATSKKEDLPLLSSLS